MKTKNIIFILFLLGIFIVAACEKQAVGTEIIPVKDENIKKTTTTTLLYEPNCESYQTKEKCLSYKTCNWDGKRCLTGKITTTTLPYKTSYFKADYINFYPSSNNELNGNTLCTMKGYIGCITQYVSSRYEHFGSINCKDLKYSDQNAFLYSCDDVVLPSVNNCIIDTKLSAESFKVLCYK